MTEINPQTPIPTEIRQKFAREAESASNNYYPPGVSNQAHILAFQIGYETAKIVDWPALSPSAAPSAGWVRVEDIRLRISYLVNLETDEISQLDKFSAGSMERAVKWDFIREIHGRRRELEDLIKMPVQNRAYIPSPPTPGA